MESAKWQAWSQLQDMAPVEAMRLYVRLLEDELVRRCCCQFLQHCKCSVEAKALLVSANTTIKLQQALQTYLA